MDDALFPSGEALAALVDCVGQYAFWGVGIAFVGWALGYAIWWVIDAMRY